MIENARNLRHPGKFVLPVERQKKTACIGDRQRSLDKVLFHRNRLGENGLANGAKLIIAASWNCREELLGHGVKVLCAHLHLARSWRRRKIVIRFVTKDRARRHGCYK